MHKAKIIFQWFNVIALVATIFLIYWYQNLYILWALVPVLPITLIGLYDLTQTRHTILRNFPVIGHFRYILLKIRPELHQYFVETNTGGAPFSYEKRSIVYQRAKKALATMPFGTKIDVNRIGYEWINHSLAPKTVNEDQMRINIGGSLLAPYESSLLNISAMSFGALSSNAIQALNGGAKLGGFAHNTGEGGISPHHLKNSGDLIWQLGTAYFGTRTADGKFDESIFTEKSRLPQVKMIEIKLSQGAKPGKGGILPAPKVTKEIANIRGVKPYETVISPPAHNTFYTPIEFCHFIQKLRELSGGKPVGFKLCLGKRREVYSIFKAMLETGINSDFITVDGGEGGTGSAPLEFSNSVGTPLVEGLIDVDNALRGFGLRSKIKILASGKITTGFDVIKLLSLGADACCAARSFMMSLGCIQALQCNADTCPVGVATQNPKLYQGLHVKNKTARVASFQEETLHAAAQILGAAGMKSFSELRRWHILKRISVNETRNYGDLFPYIEEGAFLSNNPPEKYQRVLASSKSETFSH